MLLSLQQRWSETIDCQDLYPEGEVREPGEYPPLVVRVGSGSSGAECPSKMWRQIHGLWRKTTWVKLWLSWTLEQKSSKILWISPLVGRGKWNKNVLLALWPKPLLILQVNLVQDALRRCSFSAPGRCAPKDTDSFWNSHPCWKS